MVDRKLTRMLGGALLALPLIAGAAGGGERPPFQDADADGDGFVSEEEAQQAGVPGSEFNREDIDDDGQLTEADWKFIDMDAEGGSTTGETAD